MSREHSLSDFFEMKSLSGAILDRNAQKVAIVSSRTYHEKKKPIESAVMVFSTSDGKLISEFVSSNTRKYSPKFNSKGNKLSYLERFEERDYLVVNDLQEGISERIELDGKPGQIEWVDESLFVMKQDPVDPDLKARQDDGQDGTFFEEEDRYSSLYLYRPGSGFSRLTPNLHVWEFAVRGNRAVLLASDLPHEQAWYSARLYDLNLETLEVRELYNPGWRQITRLRLSDDGTKLLFLESLWSDHGLAGGDAILYDYRSGSVSNLTEGTERSYGDIQWTDSGNMALLWTDRGTVGISENGDGWNDVWSARGTIQSSFAPELSFSSGKYAFVFTDESSPQELYLMERGKKPEKITSLNSGLSGLRNYDAEIVRWKADDGKEIYGVFRSLGRDYPLVVYIHGGPTSCSSISFMDRITLYLGQGFSVFAPNYRGSTGAGRDYAESNRGDMGGMDFSDIMAGIDYLKQSGKISTDNIFLTGGSYGGFMTSWAITQTDRFKAAAGLFGISDWVSFHGTTRISDWDRIHYDDDPYSGELFAKFSPMRYVDNVKTPVILMHGLDDPFVNVGQYYQFYRGLKDRGKIVRLLLFPREGHGFTEKKHIEQYLNESVAWFRKYMD